MAFIDGLHEFEQCLRDFMNVETWCGPASVVLLHDRCPSTNGRNDGRETGFWTGDVWKTVQVLRCYRPDLDIFTIAAEPGGLTVITGLDPSSRVLHDVYDEAVKRLADEPFSSVEDRLDEALNIVPNDWELVAARLRIRGVLS